VLHLVSELRPSESPSLAVGIHASESCAER
jgi:hypothetical protein